MYSTSHYCDAGNRLTYMALHGPLPGHVLLGLLGSSAAVHRMLPHAPLRQASRRTSRRATVDSRRASPRWRSPSTPHFAGPIPYAHDGFDEAIYVLSGRLLVLGDAEPQEAPPGSMFVALRGHQHSFSNPSGEVARVLGLWPRQSPPSLHARHRCRAHP